MFPINCLLQAHRIPSIPLASGAHVSASALSRENLPTFMMAAASSWRAELLGVAVISGDRWLLVRI